MANKHIFSENMTVYNVDLVHLFQLCFFPFLSQWNKETFDYILSCLRSPESVKMGVFLQSGYDLCTETVPVRIFSLLMPATYTKLSHGVKQIIYHFIDELN